jgi:hypothetical protein
MTLALENAIRGVPDVARWLRLVQGLRQRVKKALLFVKNSANILPAPCTWSAALRCIYISLKIKEKPRMSKEKVKAMDEALSNNGRRSFLKGLLLGGAAVAAMPLMKSQALAQDDNDNAPKKKKKKKGGDDNAPPQ